MARAGGRDRGLFQRKDDKAWWIRWACHLGHDHQERIGTKSFARHMYQTRKTQVKTHRFCLASSGTSGAVRRWRGSIRQRSGT